MKPNPLRQQPAIAPPATRVPRPAARPWSSRIRCWAALAAASVSLAASAARADAPAACQASSGARQTPLVELYTSEGCNSCPPADRWLSSLRGQPGVLAAAFHVDYWDQLGWPDRFAQPAFSARQRQQRSGASFVYTPQVLVNGRDWRGWPTLPRLEAASRVALQLQRLDGSQVRLQLDPLASAPARLAGWWALLEDGHRSAVKAGENQGETLRHDHVVRRWVDLGEISASAPRQWLLTAPRAGEGGRPARLLVVVTDAATGAPLQALQLDC